MPQRRRRPNVCAAYYKFPHVRSDVIFDEAAIHGKNSNQHPIERRESKHMQMSDKETCRMNSITHQLSTGHTC